jgi:hypothetical protein
MISEDKFTEIVNKVAAEEAVTTEEVTLLIQTIAELDQRGSMAEQIIAFALTAAETIYQDAANKIVQELQIRDKAKSKAIIKSAEKATSELMAVVQLYVAQITTLNQSAISDSDPDILLNEDPA